MKGPSVSKHTHTGFVTRFIMSHAQMNQLYALFLIHKQHRLCELNQRAWFLDGLNLYSDTSGASRNVAAVNTVYVY